MRVIAVAILLVCWFGESGCAVSLSSQPTPDKWTIGFWFWNWYGRQVSLSVSPIDVIYVYSGIIEIAPSARNNQSTEWEISSYWPKDVAPAREYWVLFRYQRQGVPDLRFAAPLARAAVRLQGEARSKGRSVVGIQLDIDSPTRALPEYALFLREVRKNLPTKFGLSITALLDWFRNGTAVGDVIHEVDEFVPQFYDVADRDSNTGGSAIAAKIDAARWGSIFNRFKKRFRIGISTFGRGRWAPAKPSTSGYPGVSPFYRDLTPIEIAVRPEFRLEANRNRAGEIVLTYRVIEKVRLAYHDLSPGDAFEFVLATPDSIRESVDQLRLIGGYLAGVVFFRWPESEADKLVMQPVEALAAAGLSSADPPRDEIVAINGRCATVECVDLYLQSSHPLSPNPLRYLIHSTTEFEYFIPEKPIPVRMTGPFGLEVSIPAYCGRGRMYLGRAVTLSHAQYTVEETQ